MSVDQIDHEALAISRIATQFREAVNFIAYIKALLIEANNLEQVYQDLLEKRWIDTATGWQLDVLGIIVGQSRTVIDSSLIDYFGFAGATNPNANSFGTVLDANVGGRFIGLTESSLGERLLTDDEYRLFIRARITKNGITPTIPEMLLFFQRFYETDDIRIDDEFNGNMTYQVQIGKPLTQSDEAFLLNTDLVPKVAGVSVTYVEFTP